VKSELKAVESAVTPGSSDPKAGVQTASLTTAAAPATPEPGSDASRSAVASASSSPAAGNNR
jgi:hypothetical protein